ncbi:4Fe-4S binding protein [Desulfitobacterium metallireducens]|uniref:4Fe-4S ferredoxin n=1 Tax=Desulfitobacterium metallireducens DSM 15288 TaxID=871968 RepID=W0EBU1_9FIRM|nr:4Fe-4S dicluster domain-containing protein [Desulfitobacterium metallireducens]AHF07008.1 4Fe-4S ferredoxin [Desulfitobacterium metallireducens DSM 15288]
MKSKNTFELPLLKTILWVYIIMCVIIAGLNYGYASKAPASVSALIRWIWEFYENWIKTLFIFIGSILTLRIIGSSQRTTLRKMNLMGFIIAALVVHIVAPLLLHNGELYFFAMPLPWTTTPLQLLNSESSFYLSRFPVWGLSGITFALIFYVCISALVIVGTLLFGRRWQCSTLCLFNGFISEVFAPAFPLVGKAKKMKSKALNFFSILRWIFLVIALFFTFYWLLLLGGISLPGDIHLMSKIENYKYLSSELLTAMFFWIAFTGRGYCYYCPLGTMLSLLGKVAGQKIITNNANCLQCTQCNTACPMSIDIKINAKNGDPVTSSRCVGCGHCVDACPTRNLSYSTTFLKKISHN